MTTTIDGTLGVNRVAPFSVDLVDLNFTLPTTKEFVSTEQVITLGGALTIAHGLGTKPKQVSYYLVVKTAFGGWSVGDEILPVNICYEQANSNAAMYGFTCKRDAENLVIRFASNGILLTNASNGSFIAPATVAANCRIIFEVLA